MFGASRVEQAKRALTDVRGVLGALGLLDGAVMQHSGYMIRCPWHSEHTPSCSVQLTGDGIIKAHCFACDAGGSVVDLALAARGGTVADAITWCEQLAGLASLEGGGKTKPRRRQGVAKVKAKPLPPTLPPKSPEKTYPPRGQVVALWNAVTALPRDLEGGEAWRYLQSRGMTDPWPLFADSLCFALPSKGSLYFALPSWAHFAGRSWHRSGYRLLVPLYDHRGELRSFVARDVTGKAKVKSVVPAGHTSKGLVMANTRALNLLTCHDDRLALCGEQLHTSVVVAEGEIDFLTACVVWPNVAVFGVRAGSWTTEHGEAIPNGMRVVIRTDHDKAGDKYARQIFDTLKHCVVTRA